MTNANMAVIWSIAIFTAGLGAGVYIDHKVMQGRIDKITIAHAEELRVREVKRSEDERAARDKEQDQATLVAKAEQEKTDEIARIRTYYSDQLAGVQNRASRKPTNTSGVSSPSSTCQGSTGADLSRQDAVFLVGEAARAEELRTALGACYQAYDSIGAARY